MKPPLPEPSPAEVARLAAQMKAELRRRMRGVRAVLPADACAQRSRRACDLLLALPQYASARTLLAYVATRKELAPALLVDAALRAGKTVALPRVNGEALSLHRYVAGDALETNGWDIDEPRQTAPLVQPTEVDLVLVPALAIDTRGYRIGYGGGFYDRLLPSLTNAYKVGLAYDFQLISEAPIDAHDVPVDAIVTDASVLIASR